MVRASWSERRSVVCVPFRHLEPTIRTGRFCPYTTDPRAPVAWQV